MFIETVIRRRAVLDEPSPDLNVRLVAEFITVPDFWGGSKTTSAAPFHFTGERAALDLRGALASGLAGQISYAARFARYLSQDIAMADDFMVLRLDTDKTGYERFCTAIFRA